MKNNNSQIVNFQVLDSRKKGFLAAILLTLFKGNYCPFFEKKGNGEKIVLKETISFSYADKIALL